MSRHNGGSTIRVLLAAASAVRRAGLEALIRRTPALKLAGSFENSRHLGQRVQDLAPDVILLDADRAHPLEPLGVPVVALIDNPDASWTAQSLRLGAKAILPREAAMDEILPALEAAYAGLVLLDPRVTLDLAARVPPAADPPGGMTEELTPRETEVLGMLAEGLGNREIASRLGISDHTVKFHISSILDKLNASSRTEAVTLGIRRGLVLL